MNMKTPFLVGWTKKYDIYTLSGIVLLIVGLVVDFFCLPFQIIGDGYVRYQFMKTLFEQHQITYMSYPIVGPLFSLPLWWLSTLFQKPVIMIEHYNFIIYMLFLLGWFFLLRTRFDRKFLLTTALILTFGSMFPGHLIHYYGEVFSAICLTLGTTGLALKKPWMGWCFLIFAVLNTQALIIPFGLIVVYTVWETKKFRYLFLVPLCAVLMLGEAYLRTGDLVTGFQFYLSQNHGNQTVLPYSGRIGYSYPFIFGALSVLFSFGKGLVFFCPGLFVIGLVWKSISDPLEQKLLIQWGLIVIGLILAYSSWWAWYGGDFWGPRFFLFASIPASWIIARFIHSKPQNFIKSVLVIVLVIWSLWIGLNGVVFQQNALINLCFSGDYQQEFLCWYVPELSVLFHPFVMRAPFKLNDRILLAYNAGIWIYVTYPLIFALYRPVVEILHKGHKIIQQASWKF
jgi:hypothetical protein